MQNARLDEAQAGVKIAGRNINNLRYIEDTTLMEESKKELEDKNEIKDERRTHKNQCPQRPSGKQNQVMCVSR